MKPLFYNFKLIHPEQLLPTPSIKDRKIEHLEAIELERSILYAPPIVNALTQDLEYKDYE